MIALALLLAVAIPLISPAASSEPLLLTKGGAVGTITPPSLETWFKSPGGSARLISRGMVEETDPGASAARSSESAAVIALPKCGITVHASFDGAQIDRA